MNEFESVEQENFAPLRFTASATHIWESLDELARTGWVMRNIPEPESVGAHTRAVRLLAIELAPELELTTLELEELLDILEVHDWPEVLVGDLVILGTEPDAAELKRAKKEAEAEAMQELTASMSDGELVRELYERYVSGTDRVASLARQLDKLQAVLLAREYEKEYGLPGLAAEFVEYSKKHITEPSLVARMDSVQRL